jgi:3-(3-hydroxy-phenyl)propionate hydroxylase
MVQNAPLQFADHSSGSLADLLQWTQGRLLLLVFGELSRKEIAKLQSISVLASVYTVQVVSKKNADVLEHVIDSNKTLRRACQSEKAQWALIRPDAYLAAKGKAINGQLIKALATALALQ